MQAGSSRQAVADLEHETHTYPPKARTQVLYVHAGSSRQAVAGIEHETS